MVHFFPLKVAHLFPILVAHLFRYYQIVVDYQDFILQNWLNLLRWKDVLTPFGGQSGDSDWICSDLASQVSYHYYIRLNGDVIPLLPESVQGVHARHYNYSSIGICYEGGINTSGASTDTRTEAQRHSMYELLKLLTQEYPEPVSWGTANSPT